MISSAMACVDNPAVEQWMFPDIVAYAKESRFR
jgi:hypothetical protein